MNVNQSSQYQNGDGSWTTTVPVTGKLGALGKVTGSWQTRIDQYGNYLGPDTLDLQTRTPKGSFIIDFINRNTAKPHKVSPSISYYQHGQHLVDGTGAYAKGTETGSIEEMVTAKKGSITSLVLITVPPADPVAS